LQEFLPAAPQLVFKTADFLSHRERIKRFQLLLKLPAFFRTQVSAVDQTSGRAAALLFVMTDLAASFPPLALLLHRHAKEVAPLTPELEQVVEIPKQLAVLQPFVTEE
jgi:hypothetical protein